MANTYTLIEAKTLTTTTASITFSSIPATYTDLLVKVSARSNEAELYGNAVLQFNSSSSNYSLIALSGSGSSAASYSATRIEFMQNGNTTTSNTFGNAEIYVPNYASSNYKSVSIDSVAETNGTTVYMRLTAGLWSNTSAITSVSIIAADSTSWLSNSTFYLYGISNS